MKRLNLIFYSVGGLLAVLLVIYLTILIKTLVEKISVVAETDLQKPAEVVSFNLEKFKELRASQQ